MKEKENEQNETNGETRREMLRRIGTALAVVSVGALVGDVSAQRTTTTMSKPLRIPTDIKTAVKDEKEYNVFVAVQKGVGSSAIVIDSSDTAAINRLRKDLKVNPARATVSGGIVHIDLGAAAEGRCFMNSAAATVLNFNPGPMRDIKLNPFQLETKPVSLNFQIEAKPGLPNLTD
jgi:hypothetical protein